MFKPIKFNKLQKKGSNYANDLKLEHCIQEYKQSIKAIRERTKASRQSKGHLLHLMAKRSSASNLTRNPTIHQTRLSTHMHAQLRM